MANQLQGIEGIMDAYILKKTGGWERKKKEGRREIYVLGEG